MNFLGNDHLHAHCSEQKSEQENSLGEYDEHQKEYLDIPEVGEKSRDAGDCESVENYEDAFEPVEISANENMDDGTSNTNVDNISESSLESFEDLEDLRNALEQMELDEEEFESDEDISSGLPRSTNNDDKNKKKGIRTVPGVTEKAIICIMLMDQWTVYTLYYL